MTEAADVLDITPDPKILVALTRTPLAPLDALCELIDNGIDSFSSAENEGTPVKGPAIQVSVPGSTEVSRGEGAVRVVDNGPGLTREGIANALRAGWTSKNPFDTLGLFGMGFNIASGKLGQRTTLTTARRDDDFALRARLDIPELLRSHAFHVPVEMVEKPDGLRQGTVIEVTHWWPEGDPNSGFVRRLAEIPKKTVREQLGRRYATLLRPSEVSTVRIFVNTESVAPFEHCVWAENRFVERRDARIPALTLIDETVHEQRRCSADGTILVDGESICPECGGREFRTVAERVHGWVGVQRFDDPDRFGIDLVRNGRAIRVLEKQAFFVFVDETTKEEQREYPIDQQYGRIVGEIHLDHVPVDFQKQDFQRTSDEWLRAMAFLRGGSLLPSKWDGAGNDTPVSRLFQGYRKVRNFGRADMYMGQYNPATSRAERIDRSVERDYYARFLNHELGYYDDARWWELVETATIPPVRELPECPTCGYQNQPDDEVCADCGQILRGRACVVCGVEIAASATACPHCGASQIAEVEEPWTCLVCGLTNGVDDEVCTRCSAVRGAPDPMSREVLAEASSPLDDLSFRGQTFELSDGTTSAPLDVLVRAANHPLRPIWHEEAVPVFTLRDPGSIEVFIDRSHSLFVEFGVRPETAVAIEAAQYLYELNRHLIGRPAHSMNNLASHVLEGAYADQMLESPGALRESIVSLFQNIAERLHGASSAEDFYGELDEEQQRQLADSMIAAGVPLEDLAVLKASGSYLRFVEPTALVQFFRMHPESSFGSVWSDTPPDPATVGAAVAARVWDELISKYLRCLEDIAAYVRYQHPEPLIVARSRASRDFLEAKLA